MLFNLINLTVLTFYESTVVLVQGLSTRTFKILTQSLGILVMTLHPFQQILHNVISYHEGESLSQ